MSDDTKKYIKDFDAWNEKKKQINDSKIERLYKEREIWWCHWGCNVGTEIDGKNEEFERPVIIFCIFTDDTFWAIPLTTTLYPDSSRIHFAFQLGNITNTALIYQMSITSSNRLMEKIDTISFDNFQIVRRYVRDLT